MRFFPFIVAFALVIWQSAAAGADDDGPSAGSADGKRTAVSVGESIRIFDTATGKVLISIKAHTGKVTTLAFSPDGKFLVSGSEDKTARLFEAATGRAVMVMNGHNAGIAGTGFSPDGKTLTTIDQNKKTIKWDLATGKQLP